MEFPPARLLQMETQSVSDLETTFCVLISSSALGWEMESEKSFFFLAKPWAMD
jgi:hypothetical protein